ncbi:type VI secretion system ATPase TssH [Pseudomonas sp. N040]|uniref:type VI secretion system ATPase TssH n=1 Tax=Pseudomonas sp. N040 TaxID=2785325 RepID=UPI0018A29BFA|nr:type VI secretion system ATPase TssH [Pseudomonas sp. N040]MBF7729564.1 type VI secretion system ATPase TssH [Pseudomonas sp. N040]MBW7013204.1 type VI secretion system ATPase TssH [Pseudomonas sp. N040]
MIQVELKPLFARLNPYSTKALENAAGLTLARNHYEISLEHFLRLLLEDPNADFTRILKRFEIDPLRLAAQLDDSLAQLKNGNPGRPVFAGLLTEWVQDAWLIASLVLGCGRVRSGALLLALISRLGYYTAGTRYGDLFKAISKDALTSEFADLVNGSSEGAMEGLAMGPAASAVAAAGGRPASAEENIGRFCEDLTAKAAAGRIDPIFGRDNEIRQMIDILARRRKNNPIAVGEPGVGKSAVVEGLALLISQGEVPDFLKNTRLLSLDLGALEAGASVKGEFENRLKGVIEEIKASTTPVILFIDEAHMLIGAGGAAGGSDAANLLKPALARGELRTIAATTWAEYKKYFEKDPALARRFQLVQLDEPDVKTAVLILRGVKGYYEKVHGVSVRDDAIVAAAELSDRYITGRLLPDKAVDLLDTASARVRISLGIKPAELERLERRQSGLDRELAALSRDQADGFPVEAKRLEEIAEEKTSIEAERAALENRWNAEREAALRVLDARKQVASYDPQAPAAEVTEDETAAEQPTLEALQSELNAASAALEQLQGDEPLVFTEVNPDAIAKVVSDWTGVPLGKVLRDAAGGILALADNIKTRICGQDTGVEQISEVLKAAQSGLRDPQQPMGVFLLVGPSGVGKTETALAVADQLFGGEQAMISINMSEYQEKHTVSRLVGSPAGYVGYGEGGLLTEAVRKRPYSVVLLDEVEKAHLDVVNIFYQVFDKGTLSDGEGRQINFSNTVVFLTSNLATDEITALCEDGRPDPDTLAEKIRPVLSRHFKPALLARMTIVPYFTLPADRLAGIVKLKLGRLSERLLATARVQLKFADEVAAVIAARCTEVETGARNIDAILRKSLTPRLSDVLLGAVADQRPLAELHVSVDEAGDWLITSVAAE